MENNENINVTFDEVLLKSVEFERVEKMGFHSYKIECIDSGRVTDISPEGFRVEYERKTTTTEPFSFSVKFDLYCRFDSKSKAILDSDLERIKKFADDNKMNVIASLNLPNRASLVIGNITTQMGTPYLSRPYLIK